MGEGGVSPGKHARCRYATAHARLIGEAERRGGARGGLSRGLPEQGRGERDGGHPRG
jgi:hypothetical protein